MKLVCAVGLGCVLAAGQSGAPVLGARFAGPGLVAHAGYAVAQTQTAATTVREFVAPSGEIFAIAWQGPQMPNLSQWLGARFAAFQAAAGAQPRRHGPLYVRVGSLVVENAGHMRAFHGRAYLADAIPGTVSPAVIR